MGVYLHIRVVIGILLGLSLRQSLAGGVQFVQHPGRDKTYWVHLCWVAFVFLYLIHFWWWEFHLETITTWTFLLYFVLIVYGLFLYLLRALLFPIDLADYEGFKDYFYSRRRWFFGWLAAVFVLDVLDTIIKGSTCLHSYGAEYWVRVAAFLILSLVALGVRKEYFHRAFVVLANLYEISYILRLSFRLG